MSRIELQILHKEGDATKLRCTVNKWKFNDAMMGEQYLTFTITSEKPIDWAVGDYCVFRGETFTLNYIPSVTQKAGTKERQDAYTYENVKFDSFLEELTRCQMLDITATTGEYVAAQGTNYTGSSKFTLFCGETSANGMTLTAVCVLAAKMQANLDRMYPTNGWKIFVDTTSTYVTGSGSVVLVTHTEDKVMSFDNWSVAQALAEVHNTFDLDYCVRGRNIYIGYNLKNLTSDNEDETFAFGYGKGYNTREDMNHGLFQIKRVANSQQQIVTRLRVLGSTKNMPYRYYNKKYGLSQSLFPTNLQLPDTFATPATKAAHNEQRDQSLAHVKGDTNDAYIDKGNDAAACKEGIREASVRFDGSNSDLPEIYPTIEEATYGELRGALVQDQSGRTGSGSFQNYGDYERIDKLLAVGYYDNDVLVDDANKDNGILPESGIDINGVTRSASIGMTNLNYNNKNNGSFNYVGGVYRGAEKTLFTIQGVAPGKYGLAPTHGGVVKYGFNLSCYKDGCGCDVGYIIKVKAKNVQTGIITDIATYNSDFTDITRGSGIKEVELPELPDVKEDTPKVSEISVVALSDIIVTFTPVIKSIVVPQSFTDNFSINYQVGKSRVSNESYAPEYTWFPIADSNTINDTFHVFVQDMGFDFEACWSDETPKMAMKSGRCVGREFEIGSDVEKVEYGGKKGYMLTLKRAQDSSLNTYYPSQTDPIAAGDHFVLLGIQMPDAYVQMAEVRLLRAATDYLADNCETKFTYQPSIDDIYLQRNLDLMREAGKEKDSIFWRLYAGLKFTFRGIPTNENNPAPLAEITIEKVAISMGESLTPKVELTLNDDVQQGSIQKLTTSVDRIYNGSIFSGGSGNGATGAVSAAMLSILQSEGDKLFLSKVHDDTAAGKITFNDTVTFEESARARKGVVVGRFQSGLLGNGALIDEEGNAEFNSIFSRNFISTPEFRFNRVNVTEGENWCTNGFGTIQSVEIIDDTTGYIDLKLEKNDYASIQVGDICRGIYNDILHQYETRELDDDSELYDDDEEEEDSTETTDEETVEKRTFGFSCKDGFFTSYFWVKQFITNKKGECRFLYELRNAKTPHPCEFMKFAQYGSFTNSERRSSSYSTSIGHYYEMVLDGVSTWKIHSANVVYRKGYLGNMFVTLKNGKEAQLQGYGLYVQDNVYFGNAVVQLDPETLKDIENQLKSYTIDFSEYVNVITVDDVGNVIGGLYTISGRGASQYRQYRIQSAISVRKNDIPLIIAEDGADAGEGTYKIYVQPKGCTCVLEDSTIYITSIDNIKDGVAGSSDDTGFDYDAMREMSACSVDIVIDCEGKSSIQKSFPIRIKHDSQPYVGANIDNEFSAVSWNTKLQRYIGLPIVFNLNMWHNNEFLDVNTFAINGIPCATKAQPEKDIVVNGITLHTALVEDSNHALSARITIDSLPQDIAFVNNFNLTATANYSGVSYERTFKHTLHKSTDTNVYSLQPSVPEVITNKNQNAAQELSEEYVSCDVFCDSSDDKHYVVNSADYAAHKVALYYQIFYVDGTHTEETPYRGDIETDTNLTEIRFILYGLDSNGVVDKTLLHDRKGVPVLAVGVDGKGVEYIFFLQNEELPLPTIYEEADKLQNDDYCPYTDEYKTKQWTDNPSGVSEEKKYEYYSMRKKIGGVWTSFGDVKEWNRYTVSPYTVEFSDHVDVITVDDAGNVIGGLYTVSGDNNEYRSYRIHSAISVRLGQDLLTIDTSNSEIASEGLYKLHVQPRGCSCVVEDSTLFITGIDNIKDGVAGTADDTNFDYDAMRQMDSCSVDITIDCEGKKTLVKSFPITIKHDSQPFIHADIDNEFSGVSWNTKTQRYIGLPIGFDLRMWHNDEILNIENVDNVSLSSATDGVTLVNGTAPSTPATTSIYYTKSIETVTKNAGTSSEYSYKIARIQITAMGINVPLVTDINVTASVIYSGIPYERTLVHTINKSTDTNVYQLQPDKPTVGMTYNENKEKVLEASTVYCSVTCDSSDDNHYIVPMSDFSTHHIKVMYVITRRTDVQTSPQNYTSSGVPITTNDKKVTFYLYLLDNNGNTIDTLDIEGVDIVSDGADATNYYLTSDINSIVKDYLGNFKGSARPTITAWKKVGENDAVRLADLVDGTGVIAEGFTIYAYEMYGDSQAYTNSSTKGILTCAQPHTYVDRFEVELVKGTKVYATLPIPIIQEQRGPSGGDGVFPRDRGLFKSGETYIYQKSGDIYIRDKVNYEIGGVMYGFLVLNKDTSVTAAPTSASGDSNWEAAGIVETVIANTVFGTNANIGGFMASAEKLRSITPAYRVKYMGYYKSIQYGLYFQGNFTPGMTVYYQYRGYNIYGAVMYQGTLYKSKSSTAPDTSKTPNNDTDHWVVASDADMVCKEHQNEEILIPDGCSYTYTQATGDTPAIRPLVRDSSGKYFVAKGSMLGKTFADTSFSFSHWREAFDFEVGGISNVGDTVDVPKYMLNGATGTMIMRQADDTIYTYDEEGKQTTGYEDGRKVVIDPTTKTVSVFDDDNKQVITINGNKKPSIGSVYGGGSGSTSVAAGSVSKGASESVCLVKANEIKVLSNTFTIGDGGWNFQIQASLSVRASFTTSSSWCPDQDKGVLQYIRPITYYDGSYGHQSYCKAELVLVKEGGSTIVIASATQGANGASYNLSIDKNIYISGGTYYLALRYTYALYSNHSLYITHGAISAAWAKNGYMGEIFANGLAFGNNAQNFFAVIKESDTNLHLKLLSNNKYGLEISSSGVKVCINDTWYTLGVSGGNATLT